MALLRAFTLNSFHGFNAGLGYPKHCPYDSIAVTAACVETPPPLIDQLRIGGRLIAPVLEGDRQNPTLLEKGIEGIQRRLLGEVLIRFLEGRLRLCCV